MQQAVSTYAFGERRKRGRQVIPINTPLISPSLAMRWGYPEEEMDAALTATAFLVLVVTCALACVAYSKVLAGVARIRARLLPTEKIDKNEALILLAVLLLSMSMMGLAHLAADAREAAWAEWGVGTETSGLEGAVLPVEASEVTADASKIDPVRGEGAMSCPVGTGLVLIREAITPAEEPRLPRVVAAAFDPTSGSIHTCADDDQNITQCEAFGNYAFDFYATRALREISMETQHLACEPFDIFEARRIFRSFLLREERKRPEGST